MTDMSSDGFGEPDHYVPSEQLTLAWLDRLKEGSTREDVLAALRDLRDNAYDLPAAWDAFTAARFVHFLAESLDVCDDTATNWDFFGSVIGAAIGQARSGVPTNWDA